MTAGRMNRDILDLQRRVRSLESPKGGFSEEQIGIIAKTYADRAFRRLLAWIIISAMFGGGFVLALKL